MEYTPQHTFTPVHCSFHCTDSTWTLQAGKAHPLTLGTGYTLLEVLCCGVCTTDLTRHKLSFPLPQITGHEVLAKHNGRRVAVEINASHFARGITWVTKPTIANFLPEEKMGNPRALTVILTKTLPCILIARIDSPLASIAFLEALPTMCLPLCTP